MFLAQKGVYRTGEPAPSLPECLEAALRTILVNYADRVVGGEDIGLRPVDIAHKWFHEIRDRLGEPGFTATSLARKANHEQAIRPAFLVPQSRDTLLYAAAFWHEASQHAQDSDYALAWPALLQCNFYIGLALGPTTHWEVSSAGAKKAAKPRDELCDETIRLLNGLDENSQSSVGSAIKMILPQLAGFAATLERRPGLKAGIGRGDGNDGGKRLEELVRQWSTRHVGVRGAFKRVVQGEIKRGRPKKRS